MASVLVSYASAHGSTRGIAERIAARIGEHGHRVDLRPADLVDRFDEYDAVVFGSAVYDQSWLPEADEFVRRARGELARRPTWLFSVGAFGDRKRVLGPLVSREPRNIAEVRQAVNPRDYRVFAGVIERHQWPFLSRQLFHLFGGRMGDNRDWPGIDAWGEVIAEALGDPRAAGNGSPAGRRQATGNHVPGAARPGRSARE